MTFAPAFVTARRAVRSAGLVLSAWRSFRNLALLEFPPDCWPTRAGETANSTISDDTQAVLFIG